MRCVYVHVCVCEEIAGGTVVREESGRVVGGESGRGEWEGRVGVWGRGEWEGQ